MCLTLCDPYDYGMPGFPVLTISRVCSHLCPLMEKAMAPHSSTLAWKIPWTEEPGRLQSIGSRRVGHDWATSLSLFTFHALEKEMATHSSILAWRIPGTGCAVYGVSKSQTQLKQLSSINSMPIESVMLTNHLILCHPLLLPSIFPSMVLKALTSIQFYIHPDKVKLWALCLRWF